jgi:hypothetical protein
MKSNYFGLADCHGLESFAFDPADSIKDFMLDDDTNKENNSKKIMMSLRANANAQRHAVVYRVSLEDAAADEIEKLLSEGKYVEALLKVKEHGEELELGTYGTTLSAAEKRWGMIPNPNLDPYHHS